MIAWESFTPLPSFLGGVLIGLAAAVLILFNGRIAGVSGILGDLITRRSEHAWRLAFTAGLIASPIVFMLFAPLPNIKHSSGIGLLTLSGIIVGIGTRYGSGCTSGHGVCGLSRFSLRSLVATVTFMLAGICTVYITRFLTSWVA